MEKDFFNAFDPKTAFWMGFATAILSLGTLGFIILGASVLNGGASLNGGARIVADTTQPTAAPSAVDAAAQAPTGSVPVVADDEYVQGNPDAKITIIEYSDYQCPFCERFHPTVQQALDEYPDDVRWVFRHFPLSFHPEAEPAAIAAECAGDQGKFWEYGDALFENQAQLGATFYKQLAADLGLNTADFNDCVDTQKYANKVRTQAAEGAAAGVTGTPGTFVIDADGNATPIRGAQPYSVLKSAIDAAL